jgi:hypothetical protein
MQRMWPSEGIWCTCVSCGRRYRYFIYRGHTKRLCNSCQTNDRDRRRCLRALDFHHVDRDTKNFNFSTASLRAWETVQAELDKCVLVCSNCHDEIEDGFTPIPESLLAAVLEAIKDVPRMQRRPPGRPRKDPDRPPKAPG